MTALSRLRKARKANKRKAMTLNTTAVKVIKASTPPPALPPAQPLR